MARCELSITTLGAVMPFLKSSTRWNIGEFLNLRGRRTPIHYISGITMKEMWAPRMNSRLNGNSSLDPLVFITTFDM